MYVSPNSNSFAARIAVSKFCVKIDDVSPYWQSFAGLQLVLVIKHYMVFGQVSYFIQNTVQRHKDSFFCTARVAVGLISLVIPTMISTFMIGFLVIAAIIGLVMAPETRRKSLKEIEKERYSA